MKKSLDEVADEIAEEIADKIIDKLWAKLRDTISVSSNETICSSIYHWSVPETNGRSGNF